MPTWLLVLIIVLVVLALFGGVGYGRPLTRRPEGIELSTGAATTAAPGARCPPPVEQIRRPAVTAYYAVADAVLSETT